MTSAPPRVDRPSRDSPSLTSIGYLMHLAQARLRSEISLAVADSGLHPGLLGILGTLDDRGPMSQKRLGEMTRIEKSSMVMFVDALERDGWVRRERDPDDRRAYRVTLTADGERKFRELGPSLQAAQDRFLDPLGADERKLLAQLLARLGADAT
jgi:DNA-binding MarR family transcriptional regulator